MALVSVSNFSLWYPDSKLPAVCDINLQIKKGEVTVICGPSGCGKTTLLTSLKKEVAPVGITRGEISASVSPSDIGIVLGDSDSQMVTSTVINDLAFYMENLGLDNVSMKRRMAETIGFFGMEELLYKSPAVLSGGQRQLAALCAAMMARPKLLLLDEPVSQLDPLSAKSFLEMIQRINEELGVTVVITEHRTDGVIKIADSIILMDGGKIVYDGTPGEVMQNIWKAQDEKNAYFIPSLAKASLTVSRGRSVAFTPKDFAKEFTPLESAEQSDHKAENSVGKDRAVICKSLLYRYPGGSGYVIKNLDMKVNTGQFTCIMGGNGSGKTTLLKIVAGILRPLDGKLKRNSEKIGYLPQNSTAFFIGDRVEDELSGGDLAYRESLIDALGLRDVLNRHPYDISAGERQRAALAAILLKKPDILLLDEPTKGVDPYMKTVMADLIKKSGAATLASTHDVEFAATHADVCMMLFDGDIAFEMAPFGFFGGNRYYTTETAMATGGSAVTYGDVIKLWKTEKPGFIRE